MRLEFEVRGLNCESKSLARGCLMWRLRGSSCIGRGKGGSFQNISLGN